MDAGKKKYDKPPHPRATCNVLSALTFSWTLGLFREGRKRDLEVTDLYEPLKEHTSSYLGNKLERYWNDELVQAQKRGRDPSFLRALIRCFGLKMASYGLVLAFMECVLSMSIPKFLSAIIAGFSPSVDPSHPVYYFGFNLQGAVWPSVAGLLSCSYLYVFVEHQYMIGTLSIGMMNRIASCALVYRKALRLSKTALGETTVGQVVNLLSNDVNRFDTAFIFLHHLWVGPLLTVIVTYFLYDLIGLSSLIGVAVLLAFIPFQIYLGKKTSELRLKTALRTDERVRLMNEIISGIQVIKMYAWEKSFASMVTQARKKEIRQIKGSTYIKGVLLSFIIFHTRIALFCSILAYVLSGHGISAEKVFVVTAYFNILRQSMTVFFPQGIGMTAEALVSVKRLQKFLMYDETQVAPVQIPPPSSEDKTSPMYEDTITSLPHNGEVEGSNHQHTVTSMGNGRTPSQTGIFIKNIKAKWLPDQPEYTLNNITLDVKPGKLVAVIGPVGAGKSSLFQAILRELPVLEGSIEVAGSISYASQEPWLFAGSVRSNILFGLPMDKNRYRYE
uniref:Probable multidrug resistance-associated protein lethal(2)03659 n=3 Tax=Cacopsylla melanoneura TaxID=428564 RepID=A0A8D8Y4C2_9HEMI